MIFTNVCNPLTAVYSAGVLYTLNTVLYTTLHANQIVNTKTVWRRLSDTQVHIYLPLLFIQYINLYGKNYQLKTYIFFFKFHPILDFPINHLMLHNLAVWPGALLLNIANF